MSQSKVEGVRAPGFAGLMLLACTMASACKKDGSEPPPAPTARPPEPITTPSQVVTTPPPSSSGDGGPPEIACNASESRATIQRKPRNKAGEPRIVGGRPSTWPFAVAITSNGTQAGQYCGGSLVGPDVVLTAAHCQVATSDKVIVGRSDLTAAGTGKVLGIREVRNHAAYDPDTHDNDIAVLKLAEPVAQAPLSIHEASADLAGEKALVVGWGFMTEGGATSPKLMEVEVPVISNATCSAGYAPDRVGITTNMLCAGLAQGGKDSCQGDSGGPLVVKKADGSFQQVGVVSFGIGCARPNKYGVYTRISNYAAWVKACSR